MEWVRRIPFRTGIYRAHCRSGTIGTLILLVAYPCPAGDGHWFPIVAGAWLAAVVTRVLLAPRTARRLGTALMSRENDSR